MTPLSRGVSSWRCELTLRNARVLAEPPEQDPEEEEKLVAPDTMVQRPAQADDREDEEESGNDPGDLHDVSLLEREVIVSSPLHQRGTGIRDLPAGLPQERDPGVCHDGDSQPARLGGWRGWLH